MMSAQGSILLKMGLIYWQPSHNTRNNLPHTPIEIIPTDEDLQPKSNPTLLEARHFRRDVSHPIDNSIQDHLDYFSDSNHVWDTHTRRSQGGCAIAMNRTIID
mmetsp:Transcript_18263/g.26220  ORF Transcript_18263/g.26220 Transcript_18263/m.26220 type:complete len:103 (+) Transcript_18263:536-844(+)